MIDPLARLPEPEGETVKIVKLSLACVVAGVLAGASYAKFPPPNDEQKAKAEETKAKAAETAKKEAELLGKAQDRVAEHYILQMKAKGIEVKPTPIAPPAPPAPAAAPPAPAPAAAVTK
jgi:hypothetical protein